MFLTILVQYGYNMRGSEVYETIKKCKKGREKNEKINVFS
jgi:hypothetical protein